MLLKLIWNLKSAVFIQEAVLIGYAEMFLANINSLTLVDDGIMCTIRAWTFIQKMKSECCCDAGVHTLWFNASDFNAEHEPLQAFSWSSGLRSVFTGLWCLLCAATHTHTHGRTECIFTTVWPGFWKPATCSCAKTNTHTHTLLFTNITNKKTLNNSSHMMSQYLSITNTKQHELTEYHNTNVCLCNYIDCGLQTLWTRSIWQIWKHAIKTCNFQNYRTKKRAFTETKLQKRLVRESDITTLSTWTFNYIIMSHIYASMPHVNISTSTNTLQIVSSPFSA